MGIARRQKRSEFVAAGIKQLILDEGLKAGDRLPTEHEMAAQFGVSRVSVREATKALSFLGIIQAAPRRGLSLGDVDMGRVTQYLGFHFALADYPRTELLHTRLVIEAGALPYVARAMAADATIYERLAALMEATHKADDMPSRVENDIAFHRTLLKASGIGPLLVFDDLLQIFFDRFVLDPSDAQRDIVTEQHGTLIRHLCDGNLEGARRMMAEHLGVYTPQIDG
jgi:GntR family transcriptional regulator, transcriptional repressor for pyruvate dehydrogenase complex